MENERELRSTTTTDLLKFPEDEGCLVGKGDYVYKYPRCLSLDIIFTANRQINVTKQPLKNKNSHPATMQPYS